MTTPIPLKIVPKYNAQAVGYLRELLERAEAGEITELLAVVRCADGTFDTCWTGCDDLLTLVGHLERMKQLMLRRMDT